MTIFNDGKMHLFSFFPYICLNNKGTILILLEKQFAVQKSSRIRFCHSFQEEIQYRVNLFTLHYVEILIPLHKRNSITNNILLRLITEVNQNLNFLLPYITKKKLSHFTLTLHTNIFH